MSDEVVICKGRVVGVNCASTYDQVSGLEYDYSRATSLIALEPGVFSTDVDFTGHSQNYGATYNVPKVLTVQGQLEYGCEYEFIMRPVKKSGAVAAQGNGPRKFKEEDE